jgi:hypothetical protein
MLGRRVLYTLDEADAAGINSRRANFTAFNAKFSGHKHPHEHGRPGATGHVAHMGSPVRAGDVLAADVAMVPDPPLVNLRVLLDGTDVHWATSVAEGPGPGQWRDLPGDG